MRVRKRGCAIVQTNVASILASGLSGPPRASGRPAVPISGFTHPLTEVFHPHQLINHHACNSLRNGGIVSTWAGAGKRVEENAMTTTNVGFNQILTDATVNAGDTLNVLDGGTIIDTVDSGGTVNVFVGGSAIGTIVGSGGLEDVLGTATGTIISGGGEDPSAE